jgi:S-DNA-T family DNA segregation ATPase FtsK/SpoIIIE
MSERLFSHRLLTDRHRAKRQLLPDDLSETLQNFVARAAGALVLLFGFAIWLCLLTYNSSDPSLNTAASSGEALINNWLGKTGSYSADLLMQTFGLGSYFLVLILSSWAWRIATRRGLSPFLLRVVFALLALAFTAITLQGLVRVMSANITLFSLPIGGFVGYFTLALITQSGYGAIIGLGMAMVAMVLTLGCLYLSCGLSLGEWQTVLNFIQRICAHIGHFTWWAIKTAYARINSRGDELEDAPRLMLDDDFDDDYDGVEATETPLIVRKKVRTARKAKKPQQTRLDFAESETGNVLPPLNLLQLPDEGVKADESLSEEALEKNARILESVLADFGVQGRITQVSPGPVVTLYELEPAPGIKSSRVIGLSDDVARSMSAVSVRIAVVPGRNVIGIELPNQKRETVYLRELLMSDAYRDSGAKLPLAMGKDIGGVPVVTDLARMPHLLVAGTTGSGKSVAINTMILSLLYRHSPRECRFIMIDPKMLELSVYEGIPHLLAPVVTEPKKAIVALKWTVREMEERYRAMSKLGVRNIDGYNMRVREARDRGEVLLRKVQTGFDPDTGKPIFEDQPLDLKDLPYIVVIVDEMADLMLVAGKDIEAAIQRLAQMARAAGIHIIMATQRPSVDVITGTIKANFPSRVSFQVTSKIDSRTILGEQGAEQLLGQGDMLYMAGGGRITRVHGPFVSDKEVESIVSFLKELGEPEYLEEVTEEDENGENGEGGFGGGNTNSGDELYDRAVDLVLRERKASTSFIQRHLQIGYNRAANLMDRMEKEGVVGTANHVGKREILGRAMDD